MNSESVRLVPIAAIKGRGATSQIPHRFQAEARSEFDDGWDGLAQDDGLPVTTISWEEPRSALASNDSPDVFFDRSINPYRGCEHGCIYCYARPTHSYLGLSPGLDFETRLIAKRNIAQVLKGELAKPRYEARTIAIGTVTDCYQPIERELRLTRDIIQLLHDCAHPLTLVTKSSGVERDIDLLAPMASRHLASIYITLTTLDTDLTRKLEPRAAAPHRRLRTIRALAQAGIPVGVSLAPQIPFLTEDMEQVMEAAWEAGARSAFYHVLRLPWELSPLFREWLHVHYPQRADRVMARVQEMRGGKDYDSDFATRMKGSGVWAELIGQRFRKACKQLGFNRERVLLDTSSFEAPRLDGQRALF